MNTFESIVLTYAILNTKKYNDSEVYKYFTKQFNRNVQDMEQVDTTFKKLFKINKTYQNLNILKIILNYFFTISLLQFYVYVALINSIYTNFYTSLHSNKSEKNTLLAFVIFEILFAVGIIVLNKKVDQKFKKFIKDFIQQNEKKQIKDLGITLKEYISSFDDLKKCKKYFKTLFENHKTVE